MMSFGIWLPLVFQWYRGRRGRRPAVATRDVSWTGTRRGRRSRRTQRLVRRQNHRWRTDCRAVRTQTTVRTRVNTFRRPPTLVQLRRRESYQSVESGTDAILPVRLAICNVPLRLNSTLQALPYVLRNNHGCVD